MKYLLILAMMLIAAFLESADQRIKDDVRRLVEKNPWQLSEQEYLLVIDKLLSRRPCNMLVFGVGNDSRLWMDHNREGRTAFLEDNEHWLKAVRKKIPDIEAYLVHYHTKRKDWQHWLKAERVKGLMLELPPELLLIKWDIIFVDGPEGWSDDKPGRMRSIYTAAKLAHRSTDCDVFVHDCDRAVESFYSHRFLLDENIVCSIDRLRHYYLP